MRGDAGHAQRHHGRVTELQKFQRVTRVFLARSLMVHGEDAPGVLRQMADELEWLEEDAQREEQERVALELHFERFQQKS